MLITEKAVLNLCLEMGCPVDRKGFIYLVDMLEWYSKHEGGNIMMGYEDVGLYFGISKWGVERAIRCMIESTKEKKQFFNRPIHRMTNKEFIVSVYRLLVST